jgi:hypothetical protein
LAILFTPDRHAWEFWIWYGFMRGLTFREWCWDRAKGILERDMEEKLENKSEDIGGMKLETH